MEQHPVPQNVTTFQFRLIGDITFKQFAYLAGGILIAYLTTKFNLIPVILRYPIAIFWALLGVGLAFVPIQERPLDRWLSAFLKSIYSPTYYVWHKDNPPPEILSVSQPQPMPEPIVGVQIADAAVTGFHPPPTPPPPPPKPVAQPPVAMIKPVPTPTPKPPPSSSTWTLGAPPIFQKAAPPKKFVMPSSVTGKRVDPPKRVLNPQPVSPPNPKQVENIKSSYESATTKLQEQIASLQKELSQGSIAKERLMELQQILVQLLNEKERLTKEITTLRRDAHQKATQVTEHPTTFATAPADTQTTVKMVSPAMAARLGIPKLTDQPNVITGIIKDSSGILLPNLIVTVKDKEGVPVRALKTNKLGQFAASTPLPAGTYLIEVEDTKKKFEFHRIEVALADAVLPPLEISAVSQRDMMRQKLTQEIFGSNNM